MNKMRFINKGWFEVESSKVMIERLDRRWISNRQSTTTAAEPLCINNMQKRGVIHKKRSTILWRCHMTSVLQPQVTGNMCAKFCEIWTYCIWDIQVYRQAHRQTDRKKDIQTCWSRYFAPPHFGTKQTHSLVTFTAI